MAIRRSSRARSRLSIATVPPPSELDFDALNAGDRDVKPRGKPRGTLSDWGDVVAEEMWKSVSVFVSPELPAVLGDPQRLRRVLANPIGNALRHSGSGEVRVEGAAAPDAAEVTISVVDHGRDIPEAEQAQIFEKFHSVRRFPADDPSSDTGLGLPFCKLAVEYMGGRISLRSTQGERTESAVTLPVAGASL